LGCLVADVVEDLGHHSKLGGSVMNEITLISEPHSRQVNRRAFDFKNAAQHLSPLTPETSALGGRRQIVVDAIQPVHLWSAALVKPFVAVPSRRWNNSRNILWYGAWAPGHA